MSKLYPHTVQFFQPGPQTGEGALGYGGQTQGAEVPRHDNPVACNIELRREGQKNTTGLPGDANRPTYDIRISRRGLSNGTVKDRDIAVDGFGQRYIVQSNYWNILGYAIRAERLEA